MPSNVVQRNHIGIDGLGVYIGVILVHAGKQVEPCIDGLLLIHIWGRKQYFEMRRGDRLITPEQQQDVVDCCRHHGWTGPIVYDGEVEDWDW